MTRRRLAAAVLVTSSAAVVLAAASSCSSFGSDGVSPAEASIDGQGDAGGLIDGPTTTDAPTDSPPRTRLLADGACADPIAYDFLDFEIPIQPALWDIDKTTQGSTLVFSTTGGVGDGGSLEVDLDVDAGVQGPYAQLTRRFDVSPGEIELSLDYTAPSAPNLYATPGCALIFRTSSTALPRTDLFTSTFGAGPYLRAVSTLADGGRIDTETPSALEQARTGYYHLELRIIVAPDGLSAIANYKAGTSAGGLAFPIVGGPATYVRLSCGLYADSENGAGPQEAHLDNIRFAVCRAR